MAKTIRDLLVKVGVKADSSQLNKLDKKLGMTTQTAMRLGVAIAATGAAFVGITNYFSKAGGEAEKTRVSFETMLGSAEKADKLIKDMRGFALETPFNYKEVVKGTKQLLAMGSSMDTVLTEARQLGDIAAGLNVPMTRLITVFGQIRAKGLLDAQDMRQFTEAGVPMVEMLSKITGHTKAAIQQSPKDLGITFENVAEALDKMTGKGGKFNNLMGDLAQTMDGLKSNVGVFWSLIKEDVGVEINKDLKPLVESLFKFLKENQAVIAKRIAGALRSMIQSLKTIGSFLFKFRKAFAFIAVLAGLAAVGKAVAMLGGSIALLGNISLIAWAKTLGPLIAIGALAAAVYLIVQDIWTAFTSPEANSGLKSLLLQLGVWEDMWKAIENVKKAYLDYKNIFFGEDKSKDTMSLGLGIKPQKGVFDKAWENVIDFFAGERTSQYKPGFGATAPAGYVSPAQASYVAPGKGDNYDVKIYASGDADGGKIASDFVKGVRSANKNTGQGQK